MLSKSEKIVNYELKYQNSFFFNLKGIKVIIKKIRVPLFNC